MTGPTATSRPGRWEIPVLDSHDRQRTLQIIVSEGRVVMLGPPGEAWTIPPESDMKLFDAMREARATANQLGGS